MSDQTINILQFIIAGVGALAWLQPLLIKWLTKPEIDGKIITSMRQHGDLYFSDQPKEVVYYFLKLSLVSLNKQFNLKSFRVTIKFEGEDTYKNTELFWAFGLNFQFNGKSWDLNPPNNEVLMYQTQLPKDSPVITYVTFYIPGGQNLKPSSYMFQFTEFNGQIHNLVMNEPDYKNNLVDLKIWHQRI